MPTALPTTWLDADALRERVDSPTFLAGVHDPDAAILEPARLAWGLRDACLSAGRADRRADAGRPGSRASGGGVTVQTAAGPVQRASVVLATNAFPPLLRRLRLMTVPVYDYALMTEPLTADQREAIGWRGREGISDLGNQFHYFRTTRDGRILWGGYDAIYHYGSGVKDEYDQRAETFEALAAELLHHLPAAGRAALQPRLGRGDRHLHQVRRVLRHGAGRPGRLRARLHRPRRRRDPVRRRRAARPARRGGHPAHPAGDGPQEAAPVPPGAPRWVGIEATRRSLARADANGGQENLWLKAMDRLGLGFDS